MNAIPPDKGNMKIIDPTLFCAILASSNTSTNAAVTSTHHLLAILAAPGINDMTWDELFNKLKPLCFPSTLSEHDQDKFGNVQCRDDVHALSLSVSSADKIGFITASFVGANKCEEFKAIISRKFGKPVTSVRKCHYEWEPKAPKGEPRRYVTLEASSEVDKIFFSIGEDQGP